MSHSIYHSIWVSLHHSRSLCVSLSLTGYVPCVSRVSSRNCKCRWRCVIDYYIANYLSRYEILSPSCSFLRSIVKASSLWSSFDHDSPSDLDSTFAASDFAIHLHVVTTYPYLLNYLQPLSIQVLILVPFPFPVSLTTVPCSAIDSPFTTGLILRPIHRMQRNWICI